MRCPNCDVFHSNYKCERKKKLRKFEWEELVKDLHNEGGFITCRGKVYGGWLVKNLCWESNDKVQSESMVFIPDPNHEWEIVE